MILLIIALFGLVVPNGFFLYWLLYLEFYQFKQLSIAANRLFL